MHLYYIYSTTIIILAFVAFLICLTDSRESNFRKTYFLNVKAFDKFSAAVFTLFKKTCIFKICILL